MHSHPVVQTFFLLFLCAATFGAELDPQSTSAPASASLAIPENADAAFALYYAALRGAKCEEAEVLLAQLESRFPDAPALPKAQQDLAGVLLRLGKSKRAAEVLQKIVESRDNGDRSIDQVRVDYAHALARLGRRAEARMVLASLAESGDQRSVNLAYSALRQMHLSADASEEDLKVWKDALADLEQSSPEGIKQSARDKIQFLEAQSSGDAVSVLYRDFIKKFEEYKGHVRQRDFAKASQSLSESDAACEVWAKSLAELDAATPLKNIAPLLEALRFSGTVKFYLGEYEAAQQAFARILMYKDDSRQKSPRAMSAAKYHQILCDKALGKPSEQIESDLIALLSDPGLSMEDVIAAFDLLAQQELAQKNAAAAHQYCCEIANGVSDVRDAVGCVQRLDAMEQEMPELALLPPPGEPSRAWAALEKAGRIEIDTTTGRSMIKASIQTKAATQPEAE